MRGTVLLEYSRLFYTCAHPGFREVLTNERAILHIPFLA